MYGGYIVGMDQLVKCVNGGFVLGCYVVDGMMLYVSNGVGLWLGFVVCIGVLLEIILIMLCSVWQLQISVVGMCVIVYFGGEVLCGGDLLYVELGGYWVGGI